MTHFVLVRHGQSEANEKQIFTGHLDVCLTDAGRLQANKSGEYINSNFKIDRIYSSDLKRAHETACIIAKCIGYGAENIVKDSAFREIYAGEWEGIPYKEVPERYPEAYKLWMDNTAECRIPGGESVLEVYNRVSERLKELAFANDGKTVMVVCHATPIRTVLANALYGSISEIDKIGVGNASVVYAEFDSDSSKLIVNRENAVWTPKLEGIPKNDGTANF